MKTEKIDNTDRALRRDAAIENNIALFNELLSSFEDYSSNRIEIGSMVYHFVSPPDLFSQLIDLGMMIQLDVLNEKTDWETAYHRLINLIEKEHKEIRGINEKYQEMEASSKELYKAAISSYYKIRNILELPPE